MKHLPAEAKRVIYLTLTLATLIVVSVVTAYQYANDTPIQPMELSACSTLEFENNNQECKDRSGALLPRELQPFVLNENLVFHVSGDLKNLADEPVSYSVVVSWISSTGSVLTEPGDTFVGFSAPVTWQPHIDQTYTVDWSPPARLLEAAAGLPPGTDLGRWRIVGTATPVNPQKYVPFQWDSVRSFTLSTPN